MLAQAPTTEPTSPDIPRRVLFLTNKQVEVENSLEQSIGKYWFDGDGRRIKKHVPSTGEVTVFVYDAGGKMVGEYSTIVETQSPKVSYTTADHLGSPRILTDQNGATISRRDFHPFGEEISTPDRINTLGYQADEIRQKFTGYERDIESELDFAQARMYNPVHGRFTAVDPYNIIFEAEDSEKNKKGEGQKLFNQYISQPQNWNRYVYVWNNPLRNVDPDGEKVYVIFYTTGNKEGDEEFRRVAETRANDIKNSKGFDPKKDIVLVQGVKGLDDMQSAMKMANALDTTWGKVQEVALVSHGGPADGPIFEYRTANQNQPNQRLFDLKVNWASNGEAVFLGCNTAVSFAQKFANAHNRDAWGFTTGTTFYSEANPKTPKGSWLLVRPGAYDYMIFNTPLYMKSQGNNPNGNFVRRTPRRY